MAVCASFMFYSTFVSYTSFIWVVLPIMPLALLNAMRNNLVENCETTIHEMNLMRNG